MYALVCSLHPDACGHLWRLTKLDEPPTGLYNQAIETLLEKRLHRFRQVAHDVRFQVAELIQNGEGPVLEDGIGIYD